MGQYGLKNDWNKHILRVTVSPAYLSEWINIYFFQNLINIG